MNLFFNYSLKNISTVNVALQFITPRLKTSIKNYLVENYSVDEYAFKIEENLKSCNTLISDVVAQDIERCNLPYDLKLHLKDAVRFIELNFNLCISAYKDLFKTCGWDCFIDNLKWTQAATFDAEKTVDAILKSENIDIYDRLNLSCFYCRKESFLELWVHIPDAGKTIFLETDIEDFDEGFGGTWMNWVKNLFASNENVWDDEIYFQFFEDALLDEVVLAVKYFWQQLAPPNKYTAFEANFFPLYGRFFDFVSYVGPEYREQLLTENCDLYLHSLLEFWMWHEKLVVETNKYESLLEYTEFQEILELISFKMRLYPTSDKLTRLLRQFWLTFSEQILKGDDTPSNFDPIFSVLIERQDSVSLKMVFSGLKPHSKQRVRKRFPMIEPFII